MVFVHKLRNEVLCLATNIFPMTLIESQLLRLYVMIQLVLVLTIKGRISTHQYIGQNTYAPNVTFLIIIAVDDLRRKIYWSTYESFQASKNLTQTNYLRCFTSNLLESPKSISFGSDVIDLSENMIFSGLMSRCTIPLSWM